MIFNHNIRWNKSRQHKKLRLVDGVFILNKFVIKVKNMPIQPAGNYIVDQSENRCHKEAENKFVYNTEIHISGQQHGQTMECIETKNMSAEKLKQRIINVDFHGNANNQDHHHTAA